MTKYKEKHGPFAEVNDLLSLDGFGHKVVEKFCESVLTTPPNDGKKKKDTSQYYSPKLREDVRKRIKSCLGVNVTVNNISWAKLTLNSDPTKPMKFTAWSDYAIDDKKLHLVDLVSITKLICADMPQADAYVLETPPVSQPTLPGKNVTHVNVNLQRSQLIGMTALGLLHKQQETIEPAIPSQQVFFLRNFLPSRVFRTLVGSERVSTENAVLDLLRYEFSGAELAASDTIPSLAGQVTASPEIRKFYEGAEGYRRDHLGQAFLTALCFARLCVLRCDKTLAALETRKQ